jgi:hypothetical protein
VNTSSGIKKMQIESLGIFRVQERKKNKLIFERGNTLANSSITLADREQKSSTLKNILTSFSKSYL